MKSNIVIPLVAAMGMATGGTAIADKEAERVCTRTTVHEVVPCKTKCCKNSKAKRGPRGLKGKKGDPGIDGAKGDRGPRGGLVYLEGIDGRDGAPGRNGRDITSGASLIIGYSGYALWPEREYTWLHGPSLQLQLPVKNGRYAVLEGTWAPGRKGGLALRAAGVEMLDEQFGLSVGVVGISVGRNDGYEDGDFIALTPSMVVHEDLVDGLYLRAEGGLLVGGAAFEDDWNLVGGLFGSLSLSADW